MMITSGCGKHNLGFLYGKYLNLPSSVLFIVMSSAN
jgi:hypothetical protein